MKTLSRILSFIVILTILAACAPAQPVTVVETVVVEKPVEKVVQQTVVVKGEPEVQIITATPLPKVDKVSLRTNWMWYGSHSIFFLGKEKGFYAGQNIDVDVKQGNGSGNVVKLVANKDSTFGYVSGAALILQVAQGAPVIAVATIDAQGADAVICRPDSGVKTLKDLEGKTLMTTAGAGVNAFWPVVVANAGLDEKKIKLTNVAENALVPLYLKNNAPCILGGLDDKPAEIEANGGDKPLVFSYTDYGVYQPGYVIVAHKDTVRDNPDLVKRFVLATLQSVNAAMANPDESVAALSKWSTLDEAGIAQARKVLDVTLAIIWSPNNTDKVLGMNQEKDFEVAIDLFKKYKDLKTDLPATAFFTNEFVPKTLP